MWISHDLVGEAAQLLYLHHHLVALVIEGGHSYLDRARLLLDWASQDSRTVVSAR